METKVILWESSLEIDAGDINFRIYKDPNINYIIIEKQLSTGAWVKLKTYDQYRAYVLEEAFLDIHFKLHELQTAVIKLSGEF